MFLRSLTTNILSHEQVALQHYHTCETLKKKNDYGPPLVGEYESNTHAHTHASTNELRHSIDVIKIDRESS